MRSLLQISIGPVQAFIAASRKTRDLAAGSHLLSRLSTVAARSLADDGAELIFPPDPAAPAANVLLAVVSDGPAEISARARERVKEALRREIETTMDTHGVRRLVDPDVPIEEHVDRGIEWFAAWTPYEPDQYGEARRRVAKIMAGRKALRDFDPAPSEGYGRPKSPLDPSFSGVLKIGPGFRVDRGTDIRVKEREHLDAIGLVKRFGDTGHANRFPSTRQISVADILQTGDPSLISALSNALTGYEDVVDMGDALYGDLDDLPEDARDRVQRAARAVLRDIGTGSLRGYYAVIHADGDRMGELLDDLGQAGIEAHREFSEGLSRFSSAVPAIVERHHGEWVFAGGDDVLALAPLSTAVALASALREAFDSAIDEFLRRRGATAKDRPTLTVGVGAAHVLENLQDAVDFAREMERCGKTTVFAGGKTKNALAIGAKPRGGASIRACGRWDEGFVERFEEHLGLLSPRTSGSGLPRGFPYEVRALGIEIREAVQSGALSGEDATDLAGREVARILRRKEASRDYIEAWSGFAQWEDLEAYADLLLVAHFFTREGAE